VIVQPSALDAILSNPGIRS
ncbi:hypothetical protein A2U01_0073872, partial [Trifolium medium]|nr:hypothetical protein [Trifolium medium]